VVASSRGNHAVSAKDGSLLWDYTYSLIRHGGSFTKIMAAKGLIWVHTANSQGSRQYAWEGLDPQTGKMKRRLLQPKSYRYKHRCSSDVATGNVFLCGSMDFADLKTGAYRRFEAARTSCRAAGLVPANGFRILYFEFVSYFGIRISSFSDVENHRSVQPFAVRRKPNAKPSRGQMLWWKKLGY